MASARAARRALSVRVLVGGYLLVSHLGCVRNGDADPDARTVAPDVGRDAPIASACSSAAECDDGFGCTIDNCGVGNRCEWVPIDGECPRGERCVVGRGCVAGTPTECTSNAECDDGRRCNGVEVCLLGSCRTPEPYVCDDGNPCTEDSCGGPEDDCIFTPICDGGLGRTDAGPVCTPFDAAMVFSGTYNAPGGSSMSCGGVMYTLSPIQFSTSGGRLTATTGSAGRSLVLTGALPTGSSFDVSGTMGCGSFRLTGHFECTNVGEATFTATFDSSDLTCGFCRPVSQTVPLVRR